MYSGVWYVIRHYTLPYSSRPFITTKTDIEQIRSDMLCLHAQIEYAVGPDMGYTRVRIITLHRNCGSRVVS